jgi:hypothetical protein
MPQGWLHCAHETTNERSCVLTRTAGHALHGPTPQPLACGTGGELPANGRAALPGGGASRCAKNDWCAGRRRTDGPACETAS